MTKKDYDEMLVVYKDQVGVLKETIAGLRTENQRLSDQVFKLQDGLMAIRAPEVYRDYRADMTSVPEISVEEQENIKTRRDITRAYLNKIEQPLFSPEDMEEILAPTLFGKVNETESVHGNSES